MEVEQIVQDAVDKYWPSFEDKFYRFECKVRNIMEPVLFFDPIKLAFYNSDKYKRPIMSSEELAPIVRTKDGRIDLTAIIKTKTDLGWRVI